jgi:8-oxo-dGTP pyrophosphatase MutT (NUDIX family)
MESRHVLPAGATRLSATAPVAGAAADPPGDPAEVGRRLRAHAPLGRTASPRRAPDGEGPPRRRGDDDLNPGFLDPVTHLKAAAVLVPLVARPGGMRVLLTRRTPHLKAHAGQIAFPGGRIEPTDPTPTAAALREAAEEVGLTQDRVDLAAELDPYHTRTGYRVSPIVGLIDPAAPLVPDPFEVAEVFEVPLAFILDPKSRETHSWIVHGEERHYHVFCYGAYYIWGATAGMLVNLAEVLTRPC